MNEDTIAHARLFQIKYTVLKCILKKLISLYKKVISVSLNINSKIFL
jgi:hypothetical protein